MHIMATVKDNVRKQLLRSVRNDPSHAFCPHHTARAVKAELGFLVVFSVQSLFNSYRSARLVSNAPH